MKKLTYTGSSKPILRIIEAVNALIDGGGGGGGGSTVSVTPILQSGTHIADIEVDGNTSELYAPSGGGGGSGIALPAFTGRSFQSYSWNTSTDQTFTYTPLTSNCTLILVIALRNASPSVSGLTGWSKLAEISDTQSESGLKQTVFVYKRIYQGGAPLTIPLQVNNGYYVVRYCLEFVNISNISVKEIQENIAAYSTSSPLSFARKTAPINVYIATGIYFSNNTYAWTICSSHNEASQYIKDNIHQFPAPEDQWDVRTAAFLDTRPNGFPIKIYQSGVRYASGLTLEIC